MMTALTNSSQELTSDSSIPRTDEAEVNRLKEQYAGQGLGDTIYDTETDDNELQSFVNDMIGFIPESVERKE